MALITKAYVTNLARERSAAPPQHGGWNEVRRGLHSLLLGYLLCAGCAALAAALVFFLLVEIANPSRTLSDGDASTILFAGGGVILLLMGVSFSVLVRGKWLCLMYAPEQHGAKWWMFASILCVLVGPSMNIVAPFLASSKAKTSVVDEKPTAVLAREIDSYKQFREAYEIASYLKVAGSAASILSTVFFVLFLRAIALGVDNEWLARVCEWYLLFNGMLVGGMLMVFFGPAQSAASLAVMLLALVGGEVLALLWYLFLIFSTSSAIAARPQPRPS
jgi:hypothetical protein